MDTEVHLDLCKPKKDSNCIEILEWLADKYISVRYFIKTKMIDFEVSEGYQKDRVTIIHEDYSLEYGSRTFEMAITQVELHDSLINPFKTLTDELVFINYESTTYQNSNYPSVSINFRISDSIHRYQRNRYSFWQALGDIGGFNDGMCLIVKILMTPLSASLFFNNFTHGSHFKKKRMGSDSKRSMIK